MVLAQRKLFSKNIFTIRDKELHIITKTFNEEYQYSISFEEIGFGKVYKIEKAKWIVPALFLAFFSVEFGLFITELINGVDLKKILFWLFASIFFLLAAIGSYIDTNKKILFLTGGSQTVEILLDKPNQETVEDFVTNLHNSIKNFYKNKYAYIDDEVSSEVLLQRFRWLREIEVIDFLEYQQLKKQLNENGNGSIGFKLTE